jgi:isoleucyl-tRNA synthetase
MYEELPQKISYPKIEQDILAFWEKNGIFQRSIEERDKKRFFAFFEGPPTANGRPGIHHVIARTVKDTVCRLKTMQGYRVERKAGWDTHGLPVEIEVEKALGLEKKDQIFDYGVAKFNAKCKESVWSYKTEWDAMTRQIGYWVDLENPYITYTNEYIESVWWILKEFWRKGLIYQGHKILPYCPHCETPLSSHEVSQGYEEVKDPSVFVKARIKGEENTSFLVWTTTPWTLLSNVALALNPEVEYVQVLHNDEHLILARERLGELHGEYTVVKQMNGADLENVEYQPFFDFIEPAKKAYYTVLGDFVTTTDGSGIVHIAPAFGEDDYQIGLKYDLPILQPVDKSGKFTEEITSWAGLFVKDADKSIIKNLQERNILYRTEQVLHSYPHCWRCDWPLLYYARKSWYIRTTAFKDRLVENNKKINWYPKEVGEGRFGEWLENNIDWSLSRDRFWGTPLPVWICQECGHQECIGSVDDLKTRSDDVPDDLDLHKPYIDDVKLKCEKCSGAMERVPEVIDCWFDSGSMPYAQWHYPFENRDKFEQSFPADFISEGVDQTRGWFYSLLVIGAFLFDKPAYKACLSIEMILDKEGQKMSKTKGNTVDPFEIINRLGADALRWYLLTVSPPWVPTRFDTEGVDEVVRKFLGTLVNTYSFFAMYANIDHFDYVEKERIPVQERPELDRWICSALTTLTKKVSQNLERYDLTKATRSIGSFVLDDLSNWYVRRSRRRFWKSETGHDKRSAFQTLYECLLTLSRLMAPFAPFISEKLYLGLTGEQKNYPDSVHLCRYPAAGEAPVDYTDELLETRMDLVRRVVFLGRSLRNNAAIKVRQPLSEIIIVDQNNRKKKLIDGMEHLILDELNVKDISYVESEDELLQKRAEPVFKTLGPKFGKMVNKAAEAIRNFSDEEIHHLLANGGRLLVVEGHEAKIMPEDLSILTENRQGLVADRDDDLIAAIRTTLSEELVDEGLAREFINRIQNMRKEAGLEVTDRIFIRTQASPTLARAIEHLSQYIKDETLCHDLEIGKTDGDFVKEWKINDQVASIGIAKAQDATL